MAIESFAGGAIGSYNKVKEMKVSTSVGETIPTQGQKSFGDMVSDAAKNVVADVQNADAVMQAGIKGDVGIQQVVEATLELEATLTVVTNIRDKAVSAYNDILRMPV